MYAISFCLDLHDWNVLAQSFVIYTEGVCAPSTFKFMWINVKYYINYSHTGQGQARALSPSMRAGYHCVVHDPSYFPQKSKFSMTVIWGFENSTWKQPKSMACSFYK